MKTPVHIVVHIYFVAFFTMLCTLQAQADTTDIKVIVVQGDRPVSAASDATFRSHDLQLMPRNSAQDLLRIVPGLVVAQHAGGGKAEQIFLRGFDADHGTDVNISVDGAPVNMVSHGHGQGYADLHFIIPETIERLDVVKGPYFASHGDLTTAGAVTFHTADTLSENIAKLEGGLFGTYRGLALLHTNVDATRMYAGAEFTASQGYFEMPQDFNRLNLIAKTYTPVGERSTLTASIMGFTSKWNASGQIPNRAVEQGLITRFGAIDPNEGGTTSRATFLLAFEENDNNPLSIRASLTAYDFRLFSNFTFFATDSVNGDMIEQTDSRTVVALDARKQFAHIIDEIGLQTTVGANLRNDNVRAALYHDSVRTRLSTTRDNAILQTNIGLFAEQKIIVGNLTIVAGARVDHFNFNVTDLTQQRAVKGSVDIVTPNPSPLIASQTVISPKANFAYTFDEHATAFLNSGFGIHSNDARAAVMASTVNVIPRAFGSELGFRWSDEAVAISAAAWLLDLESEFIWVGDEGTTEQAGRSRRLGIDIEARLHPASWLTLGGSATVSRGRLRDLPDGENFISLAPTFTLTSFALVELGAFTTSIRLRHIGARPANESYSVEASGYTIIDLQGTVPLSETLALTVQCENLLNADWREAQFDTNSRLQNEVETISEIHYTPGTPLNVRVGLQLRF